MLINSYAKINLSLEIGRKLSNNYHQINSVFHQIGLHDKISIKKLKKDKIIIKSNIKNIENKDNLAYKAASLLKKRYKIKDGIEIRIDKNIPLQSGLGGGSSNAASTLTALNSLFDLKLDKDELMKLASKIGSDVPFFIEGKTCLVSGIGDKVKKIDSLNLNFVLIKPDIGIPTKLAYNEYDKHIENNTKIKKENKTKKLAEALKQKNIEKIAENLHNDFEPVIIRKYPIIKKIKNDLIKNSALNALMSGSGSAVFGIFKDKNEAETAFEKLKEKYNFVYLSVSLKS